MTCDCRVAINDFGKGFFQDTIKLEIFIFNIREHIVAEVLTLSDRLRNESLTSVSRPRVNRPKSDVKDLIPLVYKSSILYQLTRKELRCISPKLFFKLVLSDSMCLHPFFPRLFFFNLSQVQYPHYGFHMWGLVTTLALAEWVCWTNICSRDGRIVYLVLEMMILLLIELVWMTWIEKVTL